jgi:hypothetical protein
MLVHTATSEMHIWSCNSHDDSGYTISWYTRMTSYVRLSSQLAYMNFSVQTA